MLRLFRDTCGFRNITFGFKRVFFYETLSVDTIYLIIIIKLTSSKPDDYEIVDEVTLLLDKHNRQV